MYPKIIEIKKYESTLFDLLLVIKFPDWNKRFKSASEKNKLTKNIILYLAKKIIFQDTV